MQPIELRRKLAWLIGIRAVISTVLLGGAIVAEMRSPGIVSDRSALPADRDHLFR